MTKTKDKQEEIVQTGMDELDRFFSADIKGKDPMVGSAANSVIRFDMPYNNVISVRLARHSDREIARFLPNRVLICEDSKYKDKIKAYAESIGKPTLCMERGRFLSRSYSNIGGDEEVIDTLERIFV